ncbi:MAG: hypothetical protein E7317_06670 [Clostridiales bacterium]|nr:hypothetical protein [Clostridiales bacterium]
MKTTLVIMAAGMASRYGSAKQVEGMGPHGEFILEYSITDAKRAGFDRVVFIIRKDLKEQLEEIVERRHAGDMEFCYAIQDFSSVPGVVPEGRTKPFGTVHAVLCAKPYVDGPFAVLNADDYYGTEPFKLMHDYLTESDEPGRAAMVGFKIGQTVSIHGGVTRGICMGENGYLKSVREVKDVRLLEDGRIMRMEDGKCAEELSNDNLVSMNFWGFDKSVMDAMDVSFRDFVANIPEGELKAEYLLPTFVDEQLRAGKISVKILPTDAQWFGVTYPEDRPRVVEALKALHDAGVYA